MKSLTGQTFTSNGKLFRVGERMPATPSESDVSEDLRKRSRSYTCTAEDGEVQILSSRAINTLTSGHELPARAAKTAIKPSDVLDETRCLEQCEYLLSLVEHDVARVRVVRELAQKHLES